jgi:16S rRNA (cytosine1402-N4)-methyltransferase
MVDRVVFHLSPRSRNDAGEPTWTVDATVGAGGHAAAILAAAGPDGRLLGIDRDPGAVDLAARRLAPFGSRVRLVHGGFEDLARHLDNAGIDLIDGLVADLGVSSMQLDDPARGFSLAADGPLYMRMDPTRPGDAGDVLDRLSERALAEALREFGDERFPGRIARVVVRRRAEGRLRTTGELRAAVREAVGSARSGTIDSATRTFQALRMLVNREPEALESLLAALPDRLRPGGRAVFLSFHSGEDRRVKHGLRRWASAAGGSRLSLLTRRPERPSAAETAENRRGRSARLRAAERRREGIG